MLEARLAGRIERRIRALGLPVAVTLWDGRSATPSAPPLVRFSVRSPKALTALADASMGRLARHYVEQELDVEGETREIVRMSEALSVSSPTDANGGSWVRKWFRHTRLFDRKAIRHHYDVGDDFFALWLDRRRVYSCAYFRRADDTLDLAQEQKLDHICRKLRLAPGERLLDVGCGWGALIQWAAER